jgi:hypothetical protein
VVLTIADGAVRWGWHEAAVVTACQVTRLADKQRFTLVGRVVRATRYLLEQRRPLVFVHPSVGGVWYWPIESCGIDEGADHGCIFRAIVGSPFLGGESHGTLSHGGTRTDPAADQ